MPSSKFTSSPHKTSRLSCSSYFGIEAQIFVKARQLESSCIEKSCVLSQIRWQCCSIRWYEHVVYFLWPGVQGNIPQILYKYCRSDDCISQCKNTGQICRRQLRSDRTAGKRQNSYWISSLLWNTQATMQKEKAWREWSTKTKNLNLLPIMKPKLYRTDHQKDSFFWCQKKYWKMFAPSFHLILQLQNKNFSAA